MIKPSGYIWTNVPKRGRPVKKIGFQAPAYMPASDLTPLCVLNAQSFNIHCAVQLIKLFNTDNLCGLGAANREHENRLDAFKKRFWTAHGYLEPAIAVAIHDAGGMAGAW